MKTFHSTYQKGFTLIELLVVIAILGILAAGLLFTIDPLDKIRSANDTTAIQSITQLGRANDSYAVNHNNYYVTGTTPDTAAANLNSAGEIKYSTANLPSGYTSGYLVTSGCTDTGPTYCTDYAFWIKLQSKKYTGGSTPKPYYVYSDGKSCNMSAAPTSPNAGC